MSHKFKKQGDMPEIFLDKDKNFVSIRLANGVEAKSYEKDGFVFLEDRQGNIIEVQILNLSKLAEAFQVRQG